MAWRGSCVDMLELCRGTGGISQQPFRRKCLPLEVTYTNVPMLTWAIRECSRPWSTMCTRALPEKLYYNPAAETR
eukprot:3555831-Pyramimonas_sp.AAC.1